MWGFYASAMAACSLTVIFLLRKLAAPKVTPVVLAVTFVGWLTSLSVVALVPIDVYSALGHKDPGSLDILWSISYWSTQVLTWAVIPVLQGYAISGAFTILGRVWHSLKRLWVFYLIIGALAAAGIVAALAAGKLKLATLPALVFTLSNTYGLVVLVALLGYGMVEIPRIFWRRSFPEARLKWHYHRVGRAADKLTDASDELERVLAIVLATSQQIPRGDTQLRHYMDLIIQYADDYSPVRLAALARSKVSIERLEESDLDYATSAASLASLRGRLKAAIANFQGCSGEYVDFVKKAIDLEAVCKSRQHGVCVPPSGKKGRWAEAKWTYKCRVRPWVLRGMALGAGAASAVVVWSEATIGTGRSPDLSPFSIMLHSGARRSEFGEQVLVALPLGYMCACAYFSLLKLGNFSFYHVVTKGTWAYSLLLCSSQMARFAAPLCFNFLHVIRMNDVNSGEQSMVFFQKMGAMSSDVPILGQDFNTWFPLTMLIYVALLVLNWWERCCSRIFIANRFRFEAERADDEHTQRGMRLVQAEEDAISKGWPLGDGIGLFGLGSSSSGLPGGGRSSKQQGQEQSVELNASAGQAKGVAGAGSSSGASSPPLPVSTSRQPLFGGASSSSSGPGGDGGGRNGSPPSKAEAMRQKYANRGSGSTSAAAPPPRDQQQRQQDEDGAVDALFEVVESRPGRVGTSRLLDQSAPSSYSFSWKPRGR
ncbi:hypothetical protein CHLNCDRAFT_134747 [Chlorella variabilis]|uniref:Uncharacterized protein n=1 Tax=Chlorella variabilis TaxID=554065 RepID=E1ZGP1_CHLVA|nr:hypothetical protein CHLNCDRAFT_134747 [Chlorella variabilis]EFN54970.1 hypothetical protein CHLNCDRAFT_134747 [Chlorella variabilis]|eukprot:XP_005847072.1 hypothetical protein CHLNCDRAFT_134747 [Chlorella variabilis]